jgi:2-C-methyl-D-erythritol 2,4-cyclodiphosphate synthase
MWPVTPPATRSSRRPGWAISGSISAPTGPSMPARPGRVLLAEAARLVRANGFEIGNIAVQVIGNAPKISSASTAGRDRPVAGLPAPR